MLTPKYLQQLPEHMIQLYSQAELDILQDMARRICTYSYWIPAADHQYRKLIEMGNYHSFVMEALSARTGKTAAELTRLMHEAGREALSFDAAIYKAHGLSPLALAASPALQNALAAGLKKTGGLFQNLTGTTANTVTKQFENALDRAYMQITTGAFDYNTAIRMAIKDLARQGVGAVTYASGRVESIEAAVRRAVVTGVNQTALKLQETLADEMGCDLVETTAHAGARPAHAIWQGGIYSRSGAPGRYPGLAEATGYGTGAGLGGWNCRHSFFPYFEGSPRTYSPEMLQAYEAKTYVYHGKMLTEYEATQKQRYMERQIRRWKRENAAMRAAGLDTAESAAKLGQWRQTHREFLSQTGLKRQADREQVSNASKSAMIKLEKAGNGGADVRVIGKISIERYKCVTPGITTGEVVLTNERIAHIKERHPNDFERFYSYIPLIIEEPDFIIADERPHTAMILKAFEQEGEHFRLSLRLATPGDNPAYKNSVLTFMKIRPKEWRRLIKNKTVLYKRE